MSAPGPAQTTSVMSSDQIKQLMALSAPLAALNSSSLQLLQNPLAAATSAPASGGSEDADSSREGQTNAPPFYPGLFAGLYHPILHGVSPLLQATGQTSLPKVGPPIGFSSNSIISVGDFLNKMQSSMAVGHNLERLNLPQSEQPLNPAVQISNAANPYTGAGMNYLQKAAPASRDAGMGQALLAQQAQLAALSQQLSQVQALLKQPPTSGPLPLYGVGTEAQAPHLSAQTAGAAALIAQASQRAALLRDEAREPQEGAAAGMRKAPAARNATVRWTRAEHEQFLRGLEHFGTGMWSSISQVYVPTRTPAQVASHHQKFALRSAVPQHRRQKPSTLDLTTPAVEKMLAAAAEKLSASAAAGGEGGATSPPSDAEPGESTPPPGGSEGSERETAERDAA